MVYFTIFLNLVNRNVIILKLNQVTVDGEEGSHDSLSFQQLQTMLLEQFGENLVSFDCFKIQEVIMCTRKCFFQKLKLRYKTVCHCCKLWFGYKLVYGYWVFIGEAHFNAYQKPLLYFQVLFLTGQFEAVSLCIMNFIVNCNCSYRMRNK